MSEGQGFARRVTLANLTSFAPLLKNRTGAGQAEGTTETSTDTELTSDTANVGITSDPELAAAEALFRGESVRTGIRHSRPARRRSEEDIRRGRVGGRSMSSGSAEARSGSAAVRSGSAEVLLMRVRPRRNGRQLQISMRVHQSPFMKTVNEVVSAADGTRRRIGYDHVRKSGGKAPNLARFEAPEMDGMTNPVARFRWVDVGNSESADDMILQYEIFDADKSSQGARILEKLRKGIARAPATDLTRLSQEETVLSKSDRKSAQWYRLESA